MKLYRWILLTDIILQVVIICKPKMMTSLFVHLQNATASAYLSLTPIFNHQKCVALVFKPLLVFP